MPRSGLSPAGILLALGAITLLGLSLRLFNLGGHPLWLDEALSLHYARLPLQELMTRLSQSDVNPPFYYLLLKAWTILGDSEFMLRLPSALAGTLVIPVTFSIATYLADRRIGLLAAALVATSDLQIRYSQEARPYAIMTLAAALAIWGLLHLLRRPAVHGPSGEERVNATRFLPWLAYIAGTAMALHAHNTMVLLPACSNGIALAWWATRGKRERGFAIRWVAANIAILVLWSPALLLAIRQALNVLSSTWMRPTGAHGAATLVANTYTTASGGRWFMLLFMALAAAGAWSWRRRPWPLFFILSIAAGVPLLTYLISLSRPIMLQRTLLWPTLMVTILVAAGCVSLKVRPAILLMAALLLTAQGVADARLYQRERPEPWDQLAKFVEDGMQEGDVVLLAPEQYRIPFQYYFAGPEQPAPVFGLAGGQHPEVESLRKELVAMDNIPDLLTGEHRVWLVLRAGAAGRGAVARDALAGAGTTGPRQRFGDLEVLCFDPPPADPPPATDT